MVSDTGGATSFNVCGVQATHSNVRIILTNLPWIDHQGNKIGVGCV
jgi:hypothetical protein